MSMNALPATLFALALLAPTAQAASLAITPTADVRSLRQISLRFDTPMVALGQSDAAAPAQVRCTHPNPETKLPQGAGRWANERDWVHEFNQPLPAGTRCEVTAGADLHNRAGESVGGAKTAQFRILPVGYHGPRTLSTFAPGRADYATLLAHPDPAGGRQSLKANPFVCDVLDAPGQAAAQAYMQEAANAGNSPTSIDVSRWLSIVPAQILDDSEVRTLFPKRLRPDDRPALALRCSGPLPDGAQVRFRRQNDTNRHDADRQWTHGRFQASDAEGRERFPFSTRAPFTATLACERPRAWPMPAVRGRPGTPRQQAQADEPLACDARLPIELRLSTPVRTELAKAARPQLRLRGADGQEQVLQPTLNFSDAQQQQVSSFTWRVDPAPLQTTGNTQPAPIAQLQLAGDALSDPLGRPLANPAILSSRVRVLPPPAYLGAVAGGGAIVPLHAPQAMRRLLFATRGLEHELALTQWHIRTLDDPAQLRLAAQLVMAGRAPQSVGVNGWAHLQARLQATQSAQAGTLRPGSPTIQFSGVPLAGAGLHVARVRSTIYDQQLRDDETQQARLDAERAQADQRATQARKPLPERPGERWNVAQLSGLAVTANLADQGESLLWVTDIASARPVPQARVWLYDCNLQQLWQGQADAQGVARIPALPRPWRDCSAQGRDGEARLLNSGDTWVRVQAGTPDGDDLLLAPLPMGPHGWANSGPDWQAHLIQDRSLLQAGETLHLQLLARTPVANGFELPNKQAVQLSIYYEMNERVAILPATLDEHGQLSLSWAVPANAKLGHYRVVAELAQGEANAAAPQPAPRPALRRAIAPRPGGTVLAETNFRVEEFRRPVFDAGLSTAQTPGSQRLAADGRLAFFSGGSAQGEAVQWQHHWSTEIDEPVPGYTFFTPTRASDLQPPPALAPAPGHVDAAGTVSGALTLPRLTRPWRIESEMRFADPNGETQTVASATTAWPTAQRIGLRLDAATASQPARVAGVLIDAAGKPVANQPVQMRLDRATATSNYWQPAGTERALCTAHTNAEGRWSCAWPQDATPPAHLAQNTTWLVLASTGQTTQTALTVNDWQLRWRADDNVLVVLNGPEFKPGEQARIEARPLRLPASLLLTTEREGVRSHQVLALQQMKQPIALPLTAQDAPNVHVRAQYVYPWQQPSPGDQQAPADTAAPAAAVRIAPKPDAPREDSLYSHQTAELQVSPAAFALKLDVLPAQAKVLPGTPLPVRIQARDAHGRPASGAHFTVAVVDDALLALHPNESTRVFQAMWRARGNSVGARTLLGDVALKPIAPPAGDWIAPDERAQGGMVMAEAQIAAAPAYAPAPAPVMSRKTLQDAAGAAPEAPPARSDFASLLLWQTQVRADAQGRASVTVPVNDSLTRFRVVAIATQGASQFGEGEASFNVAQPLQILSGLPELVRAGDDFMQKITLRNTETRPLTVALRAQAELVPGDDAPAPRAMSAAAQQERGLALTRQITLPAGGTQTVLWRLRVPDGVARLDWAISAQATPTAKGQPALRDAIAIRQRVVPAIAPTVRSATLLQVGGATPGQLDVAQPTGALPRVGGVRVGLSASLVDSALQETRRWMRDYPYSCLEQQSSRAVVLDDRAAWDRLMAQLPKYLDANGLARFFPEASLPGSETLTLQLLDLSRATSWAIPPEHQARMLQAVQGLLAQRIRPQDWSPQGDGNARLIAAQATLFEYGQLSVDVRTASADTPKNQNSILQIVPEDLSSLPAQSLIDWARTLAALPPAQRPAGPAGDMAAVNSQLRSRFDVQGSVLRWRDEAATQWWWFMWSGDTTAARMALLAQQLGGDAGQAGDALWRADAPRIVQGLVARQQHGRWYSTSANAWSAVALHRFARQREAGPVSGTSMLTLAPSDGAPAIERRANWQGQQAPTQLLPWPQQGGSATLTLKQDGSGQPWATVATVAAVPLTQPTAHGLAVKREVLPIEQRQRGRWSVGDAYRVRLTVTANAPQTWVVVHDALPSGATPLNRGLGRDSQLAVTASASPAKAQDWRSRPSFEEHAADSYRAYYRWVNEGSWQLEYTVRLNNAGRFTLPPTRVEALYAPEVFGETPAQAFDVQP